MLAGKPRRMMSYWTSPFPYYIMFICAFKHHGRTLREGAYNYNSP